MEIVVTEELKRLVNVASKDATREALHNIHIRNGKATATNGYALAQTNVECTYDKPTKPYTPVNGEGSVTLVPASIIKDVKLLKKDVNALLVVKDKEIEVIDSKPSRSHKVDLNGVSFPDIDRVLNDEPPEYKCGFTVGVLMEMLKCYNKDEVIAFEFTDLRKDALANRGCHTPVRFTNQKGTVTGVIMPTVIWAD
jgi:hypothetical protein